MRAGFIIFLLLLGPGVEAAPPWDTFSDAWVATDALGRSVPTPAEVGPPRPGKYAGIFYFLWLGQHGEQGPFDITKILAADADTMIKPDSPLWGPLHAPHHWGESIFGYYVSEDEGVIRARVVLLDAGKLNLGLTAFITVKTAQHDPKWLEKFAAAVQSFPEIIGVYRTTGDTDYLLQAVVSDIAGYDRLYKRLIAKMYCPSPT